MSAVCIIPARAGSKRIKGKNTKLLGGLPLVTWTIRAAIQSGMFENIIMSTDCVKVADIARKEGLNVENLRPHKLSTDHTTASQVIGYHLREISADNVCYLQPTSPLRTVEDIIKSYKLFSETQANAVISMSEVGIPEKWLYSETEDFGSFIKNVSTLRSQDLDSVYALNGAIYWFKRSTFFKYKTHLIQDNVVPYLMPKERSIDIDEQSDFLYAEFLISHNK
jgi:CMP-N-acetylneuraminic acid synthetase